MTEKQTEYLMLYEAGYTVKDIAEMFHRSKAAVSRTLKRARETKCPFSPDCEKCPLPDCAIDDKYAVLLNGRARIKNIDP